VATLDDALVVVDVDVLVTISATVDGAVEVVRVGGVPAISGEEDGRAATDRDRRATITTQPSEARTFRNSRRLCLSIIPII
jgi:hypothetical protein